MITVKEKYQIKGCDFRRIIAQARKIFDERFKNKNELFAKNFSLNYILDEYEIKGKCKNSNPLFIKGDSEINCTFCARNQLGMQMIHALEIATIKCGMTFDFKRHNVHDVEMVRVTLRYR